MKSLFLAAKAAMLDPAGLFEESDLALSMAEELDGSDNNKEIKRLRLELERAKRKHKKREKVVMYNKMFDVSDRNSSLSGENNEKQGNIPQSLDLKTPSGSSSSVLSGNFILGVLSLIGLTFWISSFVNSSRQTICIVICILK